MFADDCTLSFRSDNIENLIGECNEELTKFKEWSDANKLTINVEKTNCMFISNIADPPNGNIFLHNNQLNFVNETKFLGIILDDKVKNDKHIDYICNKISILNGAMYRIRAYVPKRCLKSIYYSIIHQYILYCLPIFGATYNCHLEPLQIAQKRSIRIISNADCYAHTDPLFFSNRILKVADLYKHSIACYAYNNQQLLDTYRNSHMYHTRSNDNFITPFRRLRSTEQSLIYNAVRIWINVPDDIKSSPSESSFKLKYKNFLLSQYSNN